MKNKLFLAVLLAAMSSSLVNAGESDEKWYQYDHLYAQIGTYVHYSSSEDHDGPNLFGALEAHKSNDWLYGLAMFDNSFGQFSQYLYGGKTWHFPNDWQHFHFKLTAGVIHGYKEPWDDKIPFNSSNGWAPGIIPSFGYKKNGFGGDVILLGNSAVLFTLGMDF
ncbi:MAG TPA: hypothetical protein ENJ12_00215 [Thiolapillus brandeum]|uniref:Sn-glycerol-3-phosphate transporter n=1 Tax=Thiolapillus brandeum TaxID=1076588 RepID=A0A831RVP6_9GAMM|nr:hypothetical protein [Thiolapillus brandeum]